MAQPLYGRKWPEYAAQWDRMAVRGDRIPDIRKAAQRLLANKTRYVEAWTRTGVPWYWIASWHYRESNANFSRQMGQGDPLWMKSVHVPKGRGPFKTWEDSCYDALVVLKRLDRVKDWRLEKGLWYSEQYNGWGYHNRGLPSPYLWGGTTVQRRGKFVADGNFSAVVWDVQPGVAALVSQMMHLDPTIMPVREEYPFSAHLTPPIPQAKHSRVKVAGKAPKRRRRAKAIRRVK